MSFKDLIKKLTVSPAKSEQPCQPEPTEKKTEESTSAEVLKQVGIQRIQAPFQYVVAHESESSQPMAFRKKPSERPIQGIVIHQEGWVHNPIDNPGYMTPEAKKKLEEFNQILRKKASIDPFEDDFSFMDVDYSSVAKGKSMKFDTPKGRRLWFGHRLLEDTEYAASFMTLEQFINRLHDSVLVEKVYLLDDSRDDDGTISVMLKVKTSFKAEDRHVESYNAALTRFLVRARVERTKHIQVSFQHTEVYSSE